MTTLGLLAALFAIAVGIGDDDSVSKWFGPAVLSVGGAGLVWTHVALATVHWRYRKRRVLPALGDCLRPLRTSERELEAVIAELRSAGLNFGRGLEPRHICEAIRERTFRGD